MPENDFFFFPCEHEILSCAHEIITCVHKIIIFCSQHITHLCTQDDKILSSAHKKKKKISGLQELCRKQAITTIKYIDIDIIPVCNSVATVKHCIKNMVRMECARSLCFAKSSF